MYGVRGAREVGEGGGGGFRIGNPTRPGLSAKLCRINYFRLTPICLPFWATSPATCPKVLFKFAHRTATMLVYANPLLLPTPRQEPRYAARRLIPESMS